MLETWHIHSQQILISQKCVHWSTTDDSLTFTPKCYCTSHLIGLHYLPCFLICIVSLPAAVMICNYVERYAKKGNVAPACSHVFTYMYAFTLGQLTNQKPKIEWSQLLHNNGVGWFVSFKDLWSQVDTHTYVAVIMRHRS